MKTCGKKLKQLSTPNLDELVKSQKLDDLSQKAPDARKNTRMLGRAQQIGFLFFFFVLLRDLRDLRGCNEAQHSRWTFYEVVNLSHSSFTKPLFKQRLIIP
jgi:hypothetical protein